MEGLEPPIDPFADIWSPLTLTAILATVTTVILLPLGTPMAWWLATTKSALRDPVAAVVTLPLVLPPTVLGFYLLLSLGPFGPGGALAGLWGARTLAFTFPGLVIGSVICSLPFMVQPLRVSFETIAGEQLEAASTLGASGRQTFFRVVAPQALPGFITGCVLTFAHTVGEFGVVLMIGGNILGATKVLSISVYNLIERGAWGEANVVALGMLAFSFLVLTSTMLVARKSAFVGTGG